MTPRVDLTGQRYGKLTVLSCAGKNQKGKYLWRCECDCGNITHATANHLNSGLKSCGCSRLPADKVGRKFGRLTVISRVDHEKKGPWIWLCKCTCGGEIKVNNNYLYSIFSCGCILQERHPDLTGQKFERLTVVSLLESKKTHRIWLCKCDCGNETTASTGKLTSNSKKSCGCLELKNRLTATDYDRADNLVENTNISVIQGLLSNNKLRRNNTTGVTGVSFARGKYWASIGFQGKQYWLGSFETLEEATKVRRNAELEYFGKFLDNYYDENPDKRPNDNG